MTITPYDLLPIPNGRMGTLLTICHLDSCAILEYGPPGTTHLSLGFLAGTGFRVENIFPAHIKENDLLFGETLKLEKAILELDSQNKYEYIFVAGSSLTSIVGIDIDLCVKEMQEKTKATLIPIKDKIFSKDISAGIEYGLSLLGETFFNTASSIQTDYKNYNIIGITPNDCFFKSNIEFIKNFMLENYDLKLNCTFGCSGSLENHKNISKAKLNIVTRAEGLKIAEKMKEQFGIPYIYETFYGSQSVFNFYEKMEKLGFTSPKKEFNQKEILRTKSYINTYFSPMDILVTGNFDEVSGIMNLLERDLQLKSTGVINHKLSKLHKNIDRNNIHPRENFKFKKYYDLIIGDEEICQLFDAKIKIIFSNPNTKSKFYSNNNSLMGLNGIFKILEILDNSF